MLDESRMATIMRQFQEHLCCGWHMRNCGHEFRCNGVGGEHQGRRTIEIFFFSQEEKGGLVKRLPIQPK
jgi:hypothetical protein